MGTGNEFSSRTFGLFDLPVARRANESNDAGIVGGFFCLIGDIEHVSARGTFGLLARMGPGYADFLPAVFALKPDHSRLNRHGEDSSAFRACASFARVFVLYRDLTTTLLAAKSDHNAFLC